MRFATLLCLLLSVAAICVAQDTNFAVGPQYLMNYGSPLFFQPIATPTLSLGLLPASSAVAATEVSAGEQSAQASARVQTDLPRIYYGEPKTTGESVEKISEIEITSTQPSSLPASILNVGVEMTDAKSLRERGYDMTLGEAAAFWKARRVHASRVYTNADIARLHGG